MAWQTPKTNWGQPGQTVPGADDFNRIEGNIETLGRYDRAPGYGTATGTNAKTITLDPAPTNYYDGLCFAFKNVTQNTGAVTINVNGLGARPIKKPNGNDIAAGNLKANSVYTVRYNGTNFILQGEGGEYGTADPSDVIKGKTIGTEEGIKTGTLELTGTSSVGDVLSGKTFYSTNPKSKQTGTMPNHGSKTFTPSDSTQSGSAGYYSGITVNPRPSLSGNASTSQVLSGRTFYGSNYTKQTGTMPNRGAVTNTITTQGGTYTIPSGYHSGSGKVTASFSNLTAGNIKKGVNIGGVVGNVTPAATVSASQLSACDTDSQYIFRILATDGTSYNNVETLNLSAIFFTVKFGDDSENNRGTVQATTDIYIASGSTYTKLSAGQTGGPYSRIRIYNPHRGTVTLTNNYGAVYRAINYSIFIS